MKFTLELHLKGQCTSGKNAVIVTRTGHRFPSKRFIDWRRDAMEQIKPQLDALDIDMPLDHPVSVDIEYTAKDRIKRDVPGIIDALWHLLEKGGVVKDDTFLGGWGEGITFKNNGVNKNNTGVVIRIKGETNEDTGSMPLCKKQSKFRNKRRSRRDYARQTRRSRKAIVDDDNTRSGK